MTKQPYPYPETPPQCQQPDTLGERCPTCPFVKCGYLALGANTARQTVQLALADLELSEARSELLEARTDPKIPFFTTKKGLEKMAEEDPKLRQELLAGRAGMIYIDIRGVKWVNDDPELGEEVGDQLLLHAAARLIGLSGQTTGVRLGLATPTRNGERRRPSEKDLPDTGFRQSGNSDELVLLLPRVGTVELETVARRVARIFSPEQAITDSQIGKLPIVASLAYAHIMEMTPEERGDRPADIIDNLYNRVRNLHSHGGSKDKQYAHLAEVTRGRNPEEVLPSDKRLLIATYYKVFCPEFMQNPGRYFELD